MDVVVVTKTKAVICIDIISYFYIKSFVQNDLDQQSDVMVHIYHNMNCQWNVQC